MRKTATFLAVVGIFYLSLPAYAEGWVSTNSNVVGNCVQFDYRGGSASNVLTVANDGVLTISVNNTIANKIGWNGQVADTWAFTANEVSQSGSTIGVFEYVIPFTHSVSVTTSGRDVGFWAGWYGPIICLSVAEPVIVPPVIIEPPVIVSEDVIRVDVVPTADVVRTEDVARTDDVPRVEPAEPTTPTQPVEPEPVTPEPIPEPVIPEPIEPEPVVPEPVIPEPTPEPIVEPIPEPTPEIVEPEPITEPTIVVEPTTPTEPTEPTIEDLANLAQEDDPQISEELASIPVIGALAETVLEAFNALGNVGADMRPEVREQAKKVVIASVVVGNIATVASIGVRKIK